MGFNLVVVRAVLGWQAQWWDGVNVAITDDTDFGGAQRGKAGTWEAFLSIEFQLGDQLKKGPQPGPFSFSHRSPGQAR